MENLPQELEDIITQYKYELEHKEKFSKCIKKINNISYKLTSVDSWRSIIGSRRTTQYYCEKAECVRNVNDLLYDNCNKLCIHTFESSPPTYHDPCGDEYETVIVIYESVDFVEIFNESYIFETNQNNDEMW